MARKWVIHDVESCLLFDRNKDPLEMNTRYYKPEHAGTVRKLRTKIEEFQKKNSDRSPCPRWEALLRPRVEHGGETYPMPISRKYWRVRLAMGNGLSSGAGNMSCSTMP